MKTHPLQILATAVKAVAVLCIVASAQIFSASAEAGEPLCAYTENGDTDIRPCADTRSSGIDPDIRPWSRGLGLYHGWHTAVDKQKAMHFFRQAAELGNSSAQNYLGLGYDFGEGVKQDKREAMRWYRKAAKQGHEHAQMRIRAEEGDAKAQFDLGYAFDGYRQLQGAVTDQQKAVHWYRKAAEQGHAKAQRELGLAYLYGKGVTEDKREAVRWLRKSAEQGNAWGQVSLGKAYLSGEGVITDEREAYIWLSIAKANGLKYAEEIFRQTNWREFLSQPEIRSAQKEAAQRLEETDRRKKKHDRKFGLSDE
ncbi:MAG: sel1 repeat family protein [Gammaproteobacteria bacterium]|nr:sel1 repeat family protein [Gammaproteobacteria bacterium]MDA7961858.1 sel1 repeat family protein [Gammaproteobacteria bacterium]MDA7970350.1 sel1 repeat family protein [Gammaproteobacteria bacterium]MDA8030823.1 sel1 repeat family protein [Alphaproteobacteria bacterium]CAJ2377657.1 MAG: exported hypothetical protein [Arenicellales bacterium IbO2]